MKLHFLLHVVTKQALLHKNKLKDIFGNSYKKFTHYRQKMVQQGALKPSLFKIKAHLWIEGVL